MEVLFDKMSDPWDRPNVSPLSYTLSLIFPRVDGADSAMFYSSYWVHIVAKPDSEQKPKVWFGRNERERRRYLLFLCLPLREPDTGTRQLLDTYTIHSSPFSIETGRSCQHQGGETADLLGRLQACRCLVLRQDGIPQEAKTKLEKTSSRPSSGFVLTQSIDFFRCCFNSVLIRIITIYPPPGSQWRLECVSILKIKCLHSAVS